MFEKCHNTELNFFIFKTTNTSTEKFAWTWTYFRGDSRVRGF